MVNAMETPAIGGVCNADTAVRKIDEIVARIRRCKKGHVAQMRIERGWASD
jgi:hypothetical protein